MVKPWEVYKGHSLVQREDQEDIIVDNPMAEPEGMSGTSQTPKSYDRKYPFPAGHPNNQKIYEGQGHPAVDFTGKPTGRRYDPETNEILALPPGQEDWFQPIGDTITGGAIKAVKGAGEAAELIGNASLFATGARGASMPDISGWLDEQIPNMEERDIIDSIIQESLSMLTGGGIGGKAVGSVDDVAKFTERIAPTVVQTWNRLRGKIPAPEAARRTREYMHRVVQSIGADAGMAVWTPEDLEPIVQSFGMDQQLGPLSESDTDTVGHFIDNLAFNGLFGLARLPTAMVGKWLKRSFVDPIFSGSKNTMENAAIEFVKRIDPEVNSAASFEELGRRVKAMADALDANGVFETNLKDAAGNKSVVQLDTLSALQNGVNDYLRKVYPDLTPEQMSVRAKEIVDRMYALKRGRKQAGSAIITDSDALMEHQSKEAITKQADAIAPAGQAEQGAEMLVDDALSPVQQSRQALQDAKGKLALSQASNDAVQQENNLRQIITDAWNRGELGTATEKDSFFKGGVESMIAGFKKSFDEYSSAYKAVQNDVPDWSGKLDFLSNRVNMAQEAVPVSNNLKTLGTTPAQPVTIVDSLEDTIDPVAMLRQQLDDNNVDVKWLANTWYPLARSKVSQGYGTGIGGTPKPLTIDQNKGLEGLVEAVKSILDTSPSYAKADELFKAHRAKFPTQQLEQWEDLVRRATDRSGLGIGMTEVKDSGTQILKQAITNDHIDVRNDLLQIARYGNENFDESLQQYVTGLAIKDMMLSPGDSKSLIAQLRPHFDTLQRTNPEFYEKVMKTLQTLRDSEMSLVQDEKVFAQAGKLYAETMESARHSSIGKFLENISADAGLRFTSNPLKAFDEVFSHKESVSIVSDLMARAERNPNSELIKDGIKAQFLRYMKDRVFTQSSIGVAPGGQETVRGASQSQLGRVLDTEKDNTVALMRQVFKDDDVTFKAMSELLTELRNKVNMDAVRPHRFGSDTAVNTASAQGTVNLITRIIFGPLTRTGTRINAIASLFVGQDKKQELLETANNLMDALIVDPQLIKRIRSVNPAAFERGDSTAKGLEDFVRITVLGTGRVVQAVGTQYKPQDIDSETNDAFGLGEGIGLNVPE